MIWEITGNRGIRLCGAEQLAPGRHHPRHVGRAVQAEREGGEPGQAVLAEDVAVVRAQALPATAARDTGSISLTPCRAYGVRDSSQGGGLNPQS